MNPVAYRIKIGVTGHRSGLPEKDLLMNAIRNAIGFEDWKKNKTVKNNSILSLFGEKSIEEFRKVKTTPIAFSILSALAEGADRIVAETVLEIEGSTLEVVLPLTVEDYLNDFISNDSKKEFEKYLKQDYHPVRLRSHNLSEQYKQIDIPEMRRESYFNAGKYIVDNCDVLIAIWDGDDSKRKGGTSEVVEYAKKNNRNTIIISSKNPADIQLRKFDALNAESISQIEFFNEQIDRSPIDEKYLEELYKGYFGKEKISKIENHDNSILQFLKEELLPYYIIGSSSAKKFQSLYKRSGLAAYWLSTLAVISVIFSVVFNQFQIISFTIEFISLIFILIIITVAQNKRAHKNWLENRFLVERIRIAPFFFLSGQEVIQPKALFYDSDKKNSQPWMFNVFSEIWNELNRKWHLKNNQKNVHHSFSKGLVDFINESWVMDQLAYHEKNVVKKKWWNKFLERGIKIIFFTAMISAGLHICLAISEMENDYISLVEKILTVIALSFPVIAAALEGVRRHKEYSRNAERSEWMAEALKIKSEKLNAVKDENEFCELLKETDKLMLQESQDWMMLMIPTELEYVT